MCYELNDAFAFLDGTHPHAADLAMHAEACERCAARLRQARAARGLWSNARAPERDDLAWSRFDRAMEGRLHEAREPRVAWTPWRGLAWAGAVAALAVGAIVAWPADPPAGVPAAPEVATAPTPNIGAGAVVAATDTPRVATVANATLEVAAKASCRVSRADAKATVIDLTRGAVTFDVGKRAPGAVFQVRAADVTVTVHGTRFTVTIGDGDLVDVQVDHGLVGVQRGGEPETLLHKGESVRLNGRAPAAAAVVEAKAPALAVAEPVVAPAPPVGVVAPVEAPAVVEAAPVRRPHHAKVVRAAPEPEPTKVVEVAPPAPAPAPAPEPDEPVFEEVVAAPPVERERKEDDAGPARQELKAIFAGLDALPAESMVALRTWIRTYPKHVKVNIARYAVGYCLFKLGRKDEATKVFLTVPNPWVNTFKQAKNPPRPR